MKRVIAISISLLLIFAVWLAVISRQPDEPVWHGHRLSEWLDDYRTNLSFPDEHPPRSGFSDDEIEKALDGIGQRSVPFLLEWLKTKHDDGWRWKLYFWMYRHNLNRCNFQPQTKDWQELAVDGFQYYGTNALSLFPKVEKLTRSRDENLRLCAYEAAFFSRPPKELFLPLADRVFKEEKSEYFHPMAAQWMAERFPEEADKRGLRSRYPQFFFDSTNGASN